MKFRLSFVVVLLLILPLVLAACGGGKADNAKKFIEAISDGDRDEAEKYVCDENKDEMLGDEGESSDEFKASDIECKEDGDNVVCKFKLEFGDQSANAEFTFRMEDNKVCETIKTVIDGQEIPTDFESEPAPSTDGEATEGETTEDGAAG